MATKREWLAEQGLAKPGARGKFSKAAHDALTKAAADGVVFDEVVPGAKVVDAEGKAVAAKRPQEQFEATPLVDGVVGKRPRLWAVADGFVVGYRSCHLCKKPNMDCKCEQGPVPPEGFLAADYDFA